MECNWNVPVLCLGWLCFGSGALSSDSLVTDRPKQPSPYSRAEFSAKSPGFADAELPLSHSTNYRNKLQAELTPQKTSAVSQAPRSLHVDLAIYA